MEYNLYKSGQKIKSGAYKGMIVTEVKKGWYRAYYPSNVKRAGSVENATTSVRWFWVHSKD
jgi:hypothetical protein